MISVDILRIIELEEDAECGLEELYTQWREEELACERDFYKWWDNCGKFIISGIAETIQQRVK